MAPTKKLNLNIDIDVLTSGSAAEIVNGILEFLLHQRNQIPFVYKTYKYMIGLWPEKPSENTNISSLHNLQIQQQRDQAKQTQDAISDLRQLIFTLFDENIVKSIRFLFGSTTHTPLEAYTLHIPSVSRKHTNAHHRMPPALLNQMLLFLLTCEELHSIFSKNLATTNLFVELEVINADEHSTNAKMFHKDEDQLPPKCRDVHLYLIHQPPFEANPCCCCQDLKVFEDLTLMDKATNNAGIADVSATKADQNLFNSGESNHTWWEADIIVRGFKEKSINGSSIWN